jgi:hypothetical protein
MRPRLLRSRRAILAIAAALLTAAVVPLLAATPAVAQTNLLANQPCGGSVSGLPSCSEISQSPLDFTKIFVGFTG